MLNKILTDASIVMSANLEFLIGTSLTSRLQKLSDDDRISFIRQLLEQRWGNPPGWKEVVELLGERSAEKLLEKWLIMYTLTKDGKQFRCWFDWPGRVSDDGNHVDSCGIGCLFSVTGEKDGVAKYVTALTQEYTPRHHRSGATFYLRKGFLEDLGIY